MIGILKEHLIIFIANLSLEPSLILDTWRSYTIDIKVSNEGENIETPIAFKIIASNQLIISISITFNGSVNMAKGLKTQ